MEHEKTYHICIWETINRKISKNTHSTKHFFRPRASREIEEMSGREISVNLAPEFELPFFATSILCVCSIFSPSPYFFCPARDSMIDYFYRKKGWWSIRLLWGENIARLNLSQSLSLEKTSIGVSKLHRNRELQFFVTQNMWIVRSGCGWRGRQNEKILVRARRAGISNRLVLQLENICAVTVQFSIDKANSFIWDGEMK